MSRIHALGGLPCLSLALVLAGCAMPAGNMTGAPREPDPWRARMEAPIAEIEFKEAPLEKALDEFARRAGVKIDVNWEFLQKFDLDQSTPVTLKLAQVPARRVLWLMLNQHQPATHYMERVNFALDGGVVKIGFDDPAAAAIVVRVYDVRDLLGWKAGPTRRTEQLLKYADSPPVPFGDSYTVSGLDFVELVRWSVGPDAWAANGGADMITEYRGLLVVSADERTQGQVAELIGQMRAVQMKRPPLVGN